MLQRQFCVHVLEPSVFFFQLTQAANVGGFHAAVLCLPLVIGGVADFVFATNVSDGLARLDGFQDGDDLGLAEFALSHSGLLASYSPGNLYFSMARFLGRVTFDLEKLVPGLSDPEESDYLKEAVECAEAGHKRAAIVLGWCALVDKPQKQIVRIGLDKF